MTTICLGVRIPVEMMEDLRRAKKIVGATSYSDLIRDALRHYLRDLSILSERSEKLKRSSSTRRLSEEC